jgi:hypothetical protein
MLLLMFSIVSSATPLTWVLNDVTFIDGITARGSFTFDADAGTPCSLGFSPCGTYSNINISTTGGLSGLLPATFLFACGSDVPTCNGLPPDSTQVLLLTSNDADQTGEQALAIFFTGVEDEGLPPFGLTDDWGAVDVSDSSPDTGALTEAVCGDPACQAPGPPGSINITGTVESVPEPSSTLLLGASLGWLSRRAYRSRRQRTVRSSV